jgi:hypothetical protein
MTTGTPLCRPRALWRTRPRTRPPGASISSSGSWIRSIHPSRYCSAKAMNSESPRRCCGKSGYVCRSRQTISICGSSSSAMTSLDSSPLMNELKASMRRRITSACCDIAAGLSHSRTARSRQRSVSCELGWLAPVFARDGGVSTLSSRRPLRTCSSARDGGSADGCLRGGMRKCPRPSASVLPLVRCGRVKPGREYASKARESDSGRLRSFQLRAASSRGHPGLAGPGRPTAASSRSARRTRGGSAAERCC